MNRLDHRPLDREEWESRVKRMTIGFLQLPEKTYEEYLHNWQLRH